MTAGFCLRGAQSPSGLSPALSATRERLHELGLEDSEARFDESGA